MYNSLTQPPPFAEPVVLCVMYHSVWHLWVVKNKTNSICVSDLVLSKPFASGLKFLFCIIIFYCNNEINAYKQRMTPSLARLHKPNWSEYIWKHLSVRWRPEKLFSRWRRFRTMMNYRFLLSHCVNAGVCFNGRFCSNKNYKRFTFTLRFQFLSLL